MGLFGGGFAERLFIADYFPALHHLLCVVALPCGPDFSFVVLRCRTFVALCSTVCFYMFCLFPAHSCAFAVEGRLQSTALLHISRAACMTRRVQVAVLAGATNERQRVPRSS